MMKWLGALVGLIVLALACLLWQHRPSPRDAPKFLEVAYLGSEACASCHSDRHQSWHKTYHRTMTQVASPSSVQGSFDGVKLALEGGLVQPSKRDGKYFFDYFDPSTGAPLSSIEIKRTVGSHIYQQYLGEFDGSYYRLHLLWHNQDQRWVHMNGAFLHGDGEAFDAQVTLWNMSCVFCHNTGPKPKIQNLQAMRQSGQAVDVQRDARFATETAELGIGCEACHGPGAQHVALNQSWFRRTWLGLFGGPDPSIIHPLKLAAKQANAVCGQCHGQRQPKQAQWIEQWMDAGPSFRPGDVLEDFVTPVSRETPVPSGYDPGLYANRFWRDGSPRLSAYEYQSLLQSKCANDQRLTCMSCHSMHAGAPDGMLSERGATDAPCLQCHEGMREAEAKAIHSKHGGQELGNRCVDCHMPKQVYGVMSIKRSHRIQIPSASNAAASGAPNACLNCHAEQNLAWVAQQLSERWGASDQPPALRDDGAALATSQLRAGLFAGDPIQRAIAAEQWAHPDNGLSQMRLEGELPLLILAHLDSYAAVRRFANLSARRALARLEVSQRKALRIALEAFDFQAPPDIRRRQVSDIQSAWPADYDALEVELAPLRALAGAQSKRIEVGE